MVNSHVMLIGHKAIFDRLMGEAMSGKLHHAQLFLGPEHIGKTRTAILLAISLQGGDENVLIKKNILEGVSADTILLLDKGENLSIEEIRKVRERASQSHNSPYLIVIIENLGRMKSEAMNALLKSLEEPNPDIIFFLTANNEDDVLPTIRSRCTVTRFQTVADNFMREACDGHVQTENLLFFAMGRPGKLVRLMEDPAYFEAHQSILSDLLVFLESPSAPGAFELTRKYEDSLFLPEFLDILLRQVRAWAPPATLPQNRAYLDIPEILEQIEDASQSIRSNVNVRLVLENLFLFFVP